MRVQRHRARRTRPRAPFDKDMKDFLVLRKLITNRSAIARSSRAPRWRVLRRAAAAVAGRQTGEARAAGGTWTSGRYSCAVPPRLPVMRWLGFAFEFLFGWNCGVGFTRVLRQQIAPSTEMSVLLLSIAMDT